MTATDWETLAHLGTLMEHDPTPTAQDNYAHLLAETRRVDEHPEDYDGPCECALCRSYADEQGEG